MYDGSFELTEIVEVTYDENTIGLQATSSVRLTSEAASDAGPSGRPR